MSQEIPRFRPHFSKKYTFYVISSGFITYYATVVNLLFPEMFPDPWEILFNGKALMTANGILTLCANPRPCAR